MSDQKPNIGGGSGPFLTKDEFYRWKDEYHLDQIELRDRMDAQTEKITKHFDEGMKQTLADCKDHDTVLEKRIDKLESNSTWERLIAGGVAFATALITALAGVWYSMRGG